MSDFLKKELNKCTYCDFSNYDKETNTYHIPKYEKPRYNLHSCYLVKLASNIVNNKNSVLAVNWNNGTAPAEEYLKIYISKVLGKNIYIDGLGYDINTKADLAYMWSGWLCVDDLTLIQQL